MHDARAVFEHMIDLVDCSRGIGERDHRRGDDPVAIRVAPVVLEPPVERRQARRRRRDVVPQRLLDATTAKSIWEECNRKLATPQFSTQGILNEMNVEVVCTTDDPIDSLEYHEQYSKVSGGTRMFPAFRPDKALAVENSEAFVRYVKSLSRASNIDITSFARFVDAIRSRSEYFAKHGCRVSDHGLNTMYAEDYTETQVKKIFKKLLRKKTLNSAEVAVFKSAMLYELGMMNWERKWVQQFHVGALRNNNTRMTRMLGPDTGFDSIGDEPIAKPMAKLLDRLEKENKPESECERYRTALAYQSRDKSFA